MGLIRGAFLFLLTSLLMFSLICGNIFLTMALSFDSNKVESELISSLTDSLLNESEFSDDLDLNMEEIEFVCQTNSSVEIKLSNGNISIPCEIATNGTESIMQEIVKAQLNQTLEDVIGEECSSPACVLKALFSEEGKDFWFSLFYIFLVSSVIITVLKFIFTEEKMNFPIQLGFLLIISSLPFIALDLLLPYLEKSILSPLAVIFSESYTVFIISATLGMVLLLFGFGMKLYFVESSLIFKFQKLKDFFSRKKNETTVVTENSSSKKN